MGRLYIVRPHLPLRWDEPDEKAYGPTHIAHFAGREGIVGALVKGEPLDGGWGDQQRTPDAIAGHPQPLDEIGSGRADHRRGRAGEHHQQPGVDQQLADPGPEHSTELADHSRQHL